MEKIRDKVEELITVIRESDEYRNFQEAEREVESIPGLSDEIRKYCWENYEIQNSEAENLDERMEAFKEQYREFRENPVVARYLERELSMCRIIQEINAKITSVVKLMI